MKISNAVRYWLELPISSCITEILSLPVNRGGFGIPSLCATTEKLRLNQRHKFKNSTNEENHSLWELTKSENVKVDSIILKTADRKTAMKILSLEKEEFAFDHLKQLKIQGQTIVALSEAVSKACLSKWSKALNILTTPLYNFTRKALQQQLPTASNLARWKKILDPSCPLCQKRQTNKHVLSNCGSLSALERYKQRHDKVLTILAEWMRRNIKPNHTIHVDLEAFEGYRPLSELFTSKRPDIAILSANRIDTLELTVCHETNMLKSKPYKQSKYENLKQDLKSTYKNCRLINHTAEVSTLGIMSDFSSFANQTLMASLPDNINTNIILSVISSSFVIYCNRNLSS